MTKLNIDLNDAVSLLRAKRKALLDQLNAVDKALAALSEAPAAAPATAVEEPQAATEAVASAVLPTKVRPPRALSDAHKHAMTEGRRKALHSKDVAAGRAREALAKPSGLAPAGNPGGRIPRLVKQTKR